jgi:DtxR family Mn-dependent transcriptional regulator
VGSEKVGDHSRRIFIDATQVFLRSIYEIDEENAIPPTRSQIHARVGISYTATNERLLRLECDGLVDLSADHRVRLTDDGRRLAEVVMRKHRLAERLLVDIVGLEWESAHEEAGRWQHVLGGRVELKLLALLDEPWRSPYGNDIPALEELSPDVAQRSSADGDRLRVVHCGHFARLGGGTAILHHIGEGAQADLELLRDFRDAGAVLGSPVKVSATPDVSNSVAIRFSSSAVKLGPDVAVLVFVGIP